MTRGVGKTSIEWAVRVDNPHPRRSEKAGDVITGLAPETVKCANEVWEGWTPVYRRVTAWREPKPHQEPKLPRGTCTACGRERSLTKFGDLRTHDGPTRARGQRWADRCEGSHKPPREAVSDAA